MTISNEELVSNIQAGISVDANQETLCKNNTGLIRSIAKQYCGGYDCGSTEFEDYVQEGYIGLLEASTKYDPTRGASFSTYATWYIKKAMYRYIINCSSCVRLPAAMRWNMQKYVAYIEKYHVQNGIYPDDQTVIDELCVTPRMLQLLKVAWQRANPASIDQALDDDGHTIADLVQSGEDIEQYITQAQYCNDLRDTLNNAIAILSPKTQMIVRAVFWQRLRKNKLANTMGCTRQSINDHLERAFWKILHSVYREKLEPFLGENYHYNEYRHSAGSDEALTPEADILENPFLL